MCSVAPAVLQLRSYKTLVYVEISGCRLGNPTCYWKGDEWRPKTARDEIQKISCPMSKPIFPNQWIRWDREGKQRPRPSTRLSRQDGRCLSSRRLGRQWSYKADRLNKSKQDGSSRRKMISPRVQCQYPSTTFHQLCISFWSSNLHHNSHRPFVSSTVQHQSTYHRTQRDLCCTSVYILAVYHIRYMRHPITRHQTLSRQCQHVERESNSATSVFLNT